MQEELSKRSRIIKALVTEFNNNKYFTDMHNAETVGVSELEKPFIYPDHLSTEIINMTNFKMEVLKWKESTSRWIILHLHGGGYVGAFRRHYKNMALEDALEAYDWVLEQGWHHDQIIVAGDSAGGGLAMALCHTLKSRWRRLPAGIVAMSPWTDLTASGKSYTENYDIDPVFGNDRAELIYNNPYIGDMNPRDPRISPAFGDFTGFPPMLIQVGTDEMLLSDSEIVAAKAKSAGVRIRFTKYNGMFHVFQIAGTLMDESKLAWAEVKRFLNEI